VSQARLREVLWWGNFTDDFDETDAPKGPRAIGKDSSSGRIPNLVVFEWGSDSVW
jgi:hypothetical protein